MCILTAIRKNFADLAPSVLVFESLHLTTTEFLELGKKVELPFSEKHFAPTISLSALRGEPENPLCDVFIPIHVTAH